MKTIKSIIALLFVLLTAQAALAWYDPSTQRWLSRDPIGEPGFQVLQSATQMIPKANDSVVLTSSRWINRDPIAGGINLYSFVANDPEDMIDLWGEVAVQRPRDPYLYGDCSKEQHSLLHKAVGRACKSSGTMRCDSGDDCTTIKAKMAKFDACIAARQELNDTCFGGQSDSQNHEIGNCQTGKQNCQKLLCSKGCN